MPIKLLLARHFKQTITSILEIMHNALTQLNGQSLAEWTFAIRCKENRKSSFKQTVSEELRGCKISPLHDARFVRMAALIVTGGMALSGNARR
jgi:hypothetical protein